MILKKNVIGLFVVSCLRFSIPVFCELSRQASELIRSSYSKVTVKWKN